MQHYRIVQSPVAVAPPFVFPRMAAQATRRPSGAEAVEPSGMTRSGAGRSPVGGKARFSGGPHMARRFAGCWPGLAPYVAGPALGLNYD